MGNLIQKQWGKYQTYRSRSYGSLESLRSHYTECLMSCYLYGKSRENWLHFGYLKQKNKTHQVTERTLNLREKSSGEDIHWICKSYGTRL